MDVEVIKKAVAQIGAGLAPDADWQPILFVGHGKTISIVEFDPRLVNSGAGKEELAKLMARAIDQFRASECILLGMAWAVRRDPSVFKGPVDPQVRYQADRQETVMLQHFDGLRNTVDVHIAPVNRAENRPPSLGKWERQANSMVMGRFSETLLPVLCKYAPAG